MRFIGRAIVDDNDLNSLVLLAQYALYRLAQEPFAIEYGNYNANRWINQFTCLSLSSSSVRALCTAAGDGAAHRSEHVEFLERFPGSHTPRVLMIDKYFVREKLARHVSLSGQVEPVDIFSKPQCGIEQSD